MSELLSLIFAVVTVLLILCAFYVWRIDRDAAVNRALTAFCLLLALANIGQVYDQLAHTVVSYVFWYRVSWIGWAFYSAVALHFALLMSGYPWLKTRRWVHYLLYLPALAFFVIVQLRLPGIQSIALTAEHTVEVTTVFGITDVEFVIYQYLVDLLALLILVHASFVSGSRRRKQQAFVILASASLALVIDVFRFIDVPYGNEVQQLWALEQLIFAFSLAYAISYLKFATPSAALAANYIMSRVEDLIFLTDMRGTVLEVNQAAQRILGYAREALVGRPFTALLRSPAGAEIPWPPPECGYEGSPEQEVGFVTADETLIPVQLTSSCVHDAYRDVVGVIHIGADLRHTKALESEILERRKAEEGLRQADRAKDTFLAALSHEMLTPLTSILAWGEIAQQDPDQQVYALEVIRENANQQHRLVRDMLDISRLIHHKIMLETEPLDLNELAWQLVEQYQHRAAARVLELRYVLSASPVFVTADVGRMQQVLTNLLNNALKFTPVGGEITATVSREDGWGVLTVTDTGRGIAPEHLPLIFAPFMQVDEKISGGLGLGLAVARGLVQLHGGDITVESAGPGLGSTFTVRLPMAEGVVPSADEAIPDDE